MLWSAIAYLQRTQPDVVSLVYSGDYPAASKDEIISKVHVSRHDQLRLTTRNASPFGSIPRRYISFLYLLAT